MQQKEKHADMTPLHMVCDSQASVYRHAPAHQMGMCGQGKHSTEHGECGDDTRGSLDNVTTTTRAVHSQAFLMAVFERNEASLNDLVKSLEIGFFEPDTDTDATIKRFPQTRPGYDKARDIILVKRNAFRQEVVDRTFETLHINPAIELFVPEWKKLLDIAREYLEQSRDHLTQYRSYQASYVLFGTLPATVVRSSSTKTRP